MLCDGEIADLDPARVCSGCWETLRPWEGPYCARCGLPLLTPEPASLCGPCRTEDGDFDRARSYGLYSDSLRALILLAKFHRRERLARKLGTLLARLWAVVREDPQDAEAILIPVPLHPLRQRQRGFNQAEALARGLRDVLARSDPEGFEVPRLDLRGLRRVRPTPPQAGLSLVARFENVRSAFEAVSSASVRGRTAVLVDDVMTTGATLSACAKALKEAGASRVIALTLARAAPQFPDGASSACAAGLPVDELRIERT